MSVRHKVSLKCECGKTVSIGSVFCPHCKAEIQRNNAKMIKKEEKKYQKKIISKGRKRK